MTILIILLIIIIAIGSGWSFYSIGNGDTTPPPGVPPYNDSFPIIPVILVVLCFVVLFGAFGYHGLYMHH